MRLGNAWKAAACFRPLSTTAAIVTLVLNLPPVSVEYHRWQMHRAFDRAFTELVPGTAGTYALGDAYDDYVFHRARLVDLGGLHRMEYTFKNIEAPTAASGDFLRLLLVKKCPQYLDFSSPHPPASVPLSITIWCDPDAKNEWIAFLRAHDVK